MLTARGGDLLQRGLGKLVGFDGEGGLEFASAENLDAIGLALGDVRLLQDFGSDLADAEFEQALEVHHDVFHAENIGETALGQAAVKRHLAAFKTAHHARTAARTLAFMAARGGFAHAGAHTAADAFAVFRCFFRRSNCRKIHDSIPSGAKSPACCSFGSTAEAIPLIRSLVQPSLNWLLRPLPNAAPWPPCREFPACFPVQ